MQHAENPVDWYPWGPEALERARSTDRPILLSIGYAACHWCHVMERESFEDEAIAALMNERFVCIKVDREERPDLDDIYMAATVGLSGSGGWPMTVFLTPDQRPFFAGTYFPPEDRYGRPGLKSLLAKIAEAWQHDRDDLSKQADQLTHHVRSQSRAPEPLSVGRDAMAHAAEALWQSFDRKYGGFGGAPKFPPAATLSFLLAYYRQTADMRALEMVVSTLNGMQNGGMYDHLGGGFARYSTDERWLVPHFEKMLYDNAQLAHVYLEAYLVTGRAEYARVASETLDYVMREMQGPEGGYFSATDADSEGEEGKFFVWTPDQVGEVLDTEAAAHFCAFYDVTPEGNWEGKSVLNTPRSLAAVAGELGVDPAVLAESLERSLPLLYQARQRRVPPLLDDKILCAHNGLMLGAMAFGYQVLQNPAYLSSARRAADYVWNELRRPDGGLFRTARSGKAHLPAYLEDYAYLADGLVTLYEAGGDATILARALELGERLLADFGDESGGAFYFTAHDHEALIARTREGHDGALPNPNSIAARALLRLGRHFGRDALVDRAVGALVAYGRQIARLPRGFVSALSVIDACLEPPLEIVTAGSADDPRTEALNAVIGEIYAPNKIQAHVDPDQPATFDTPLTAHKGLVNGAPAVYVCRQFVCRAPVSDPEALREELDAAEQQRRALSQTELTRQKLAGRASVEGTERFRSRSDFRPSDYGELGVTGLWVSRIGFGGYRLTASDPDHAAALRHAVELGVNLIDTAPSYQGGDSERVIGQALAALVEQKTIQRDMVVVVTKLGLLQGATLQEHKLREQKGRGAAEMVKVSNELWQCLDPEFLEQELARSLERLGLMVVDVCLLHNPEHFLEAESSQSLALAERRAEYYRRIEGAFRVLEGAARSGSIGCYGVSSNTLGRPAEDPLATDAASLLRAAERAGGPQHHFRVLEAPINLLEPAVAVLKNTGPGASQSALEFARAEGLALLANRPLQAFLPRGVLRLVDTEIPPTAVPVDRALENVAGLEQRFAETLAPLIRVPEGALPANQLFAWARKLAPIAPDLVSLTQFEELEGALVLPRVEDALGSLNRAFGASHPTWSGWRDAYAQAIAQLLASLRHVAATRSASALAEIQSSLAPHLLIRPDPELAFVELALAAVRQLPGVSSVLVGMRSRRYVDDAVASLRREPLSDPGAAFTQLLARA